MFQIIGHDPSVMVHGTEVAADACVSPVIRLMKRRPALGLAAMLPKLRYKLFPWAKDVKTCRKGYCCGGGFPYHALLLRCPSLTHPELERTSLYTYWLGYSYHLVLVQGI